MIKQQINHPLNSEPKFFYGYVIVAIALLIMLIGYGTRTSFGVFFKPMIGEFYWTRAWTSGAMTLSMIMQGLWGIVMGRLNDKVGPRLVITLCCFLSGIGFLLMSQVNSLWQIYVYYGVIIGFGMGGVFVALLSTVSRWFIKRRGAMTGIVLTGIGMSTLVISPVATQLISVFDWRLAYVIMGGSVLFIGISLAQFLRRDPTAMGLQPYGQREMEGKTLASNAGLSLNEAIHTWQFWMVLPIFMCLGYCLFSILVHLVPHITDMGTTATVAANILALSGGTQIIGGIILGTIADRIGNRQVLGLCFILMAASVSLLIPFTDLWILYLAAFIFGLGTGGSGVTEPTLIAELFGIKSHGLILGVVSFCFTIGGAIGPLITGYSFDSYGNYEVAFLISVIICLAGLILTILLKPVKK